MEICVYMCLRQLIWRNKNIYLVKLLKDTTDGERVYLTPHFFKFHTGDDWMERTGVVRLVSRESGGDVSGGKWRQLVSCAVMVLWYAQVPLIQPSFSAREKQSKFSMQLLQLYITSAWLAETRLSEALQDYRREVYSPSKWTWLIDFHALEGGFVQYARRWSGSKLPLEQNKHLTQQYASAEHPHPWARAFKRCDAASCWCVPGISPWNYLIVCDVHNALFTGLIHKDLIFRLFIRLEIHSLFKEIYVNSFSKAEPVILAHLSSQL